MVGTCAWAMRSGWAMRRIKGSWSLFCLRRQDRRLAAVRLDDVLWLDKGTSSASESSWGKLHAVNDQHDTIRALLVDEGPLSLIHFKWRGSFIVIICYKAVKLQQPSYLTCLLSPHGQSRVLRSSTSDLLPTQSSSTNIAARRFSCCASTAWNSLPSFVLYALLTVLLVLGRSSILTCSEDIYSRSAVHASDTLTRPLVRYKFVTCLIHYFNSRNTQEQNEARIGRSKEMCSEDRKAISNNTDNWRKITG